MASPPTVTEPLASVALGESSAPVVINAPFSSGSPESRVPLSLKSRNTRARTMPAPASGWRDMCSPRLGSSEKLRLKPSASEPSVAASPVTATAIEDRRRTCETRARARFCRASKAIAPSQSTFSDADQ